MVDFRSTKEYAEIFRDTKAPNLRSTKEYIETLRGTIAPNFRSTKEYIEVLREETATQTATPEITPTSGSYASDQTITITCATPDSTIYYTTDGSTPDATDTEYTTPIAMFEGTLKAIAITIRGLRE